jgi:hypothetical protein
MYFHFFFLNLGHDKSVSVENWMYEYLTFQTGNE